MCRIAGYYDFRKNSRPDHHEVITKMCDVVKNGGPDDAGYHIVHDRSDHTIALGHRRLSILDLSPLGHQPMLSSDGKKTITFNGEIYNFHEIRKELEAQGVRFKTQTDTEVILAAYEKWGVACLNKFRGMWAFAIWDEEKQELFLCRDRVGVKPLYWYHQNNVFIFASELKSFREHPHFKAELDDAALSSYFKYGYIRAPHSIYRNIFKLEPGTYLTMSGDQKITQGVYWRASNYVLGGIEEQNLWLKRPEEEILKELEEILTESFNLRLVSDVPVGVFLSG
ncbi:MAG: asparagine synthase (glutamine-hydrolyzing), partial [bacterium]